MILCFLGLENLCMWMGKAIWVSFNVQICNTRT